jgi:hypothetical protein
MSRRLTVLFITLLCSALLVSVTTTTAEARGKKKSSRVFAVTRVGQDWYNSKLKIGWRAVPGAAYQMRWSYTPSKLTYSKLVSSGTSGGTYTSALDRGKTWYFQVRAVKAGTIGPWSPTRGLRFLNPWPKAPTLARASLPGAVQFSWGYTPYASRFRVRWSPAWYGNWPSSATYIDRTSGGWVGQAARRSRYVVPTGVGAGDNYLPVDYANPVFAQIEANNAYNPGASQRSKWVAAFPTPPAPAPGIPVRMGSYNVKLFPTGTRAAAVASNIASHGVTVAALQEANSATASAVVSALGSGWSAAPPATGSGQQIIYRADTFALSSSGTFNVRNTKNPSAPLVTPWARLAQGGRSFYVVSAHFSEDGQGQLQQNRNAGLAAQDAMRGIDAVNQANDPVIVAGDLRYGREPYGDPAGYTAAQPTFVRGGYYDAMAAVSKTNVNYSSFNAGTTQVPHPSGLGPRSDHILVKGFRGSKSYVNVINWSKSGIIPSDHNLIYADLAIPN